MNIYTEIAYGIAGILAYYLITEIFFDILLRGFAPLISSRPWVINTLLEELKKEKIKANPVIYSLSCGKSGFLLGVGGSYPNAELIGVEHDLFPFILEKIQLIIRFSNIKAIYQKNLYQLDIKRADLIYCYLDVEILRELPKKFKFECKPGTIIISNGFPIPNLVEKRSVDISSKKRKLAFLSKSKKLMASKEKEGKRANLVYFYEI
jgi:hypothetical protein